jgi:transcriptional regulator with XRE-family HTH domain
MPSINAPTLRRWELGVALRRIRESRGKTIEQVSHDLSEAYGMGFSPAKISRLENAKRGVNPRDVRDLCEYYSVDQVECDRLMQLAKDSRGQDRWQGLAEAYGTFIALETIAVRARAYESMYVPGLLQTKEYSQTVESIEVPGARAETPPSRRIEDRVALREQRQQRVHSDDALELHVVIDENVLRRVVGSPEVMTAQLAHLVEVSRLPNVTLQVKPIADGLYPGSEASSFTLLDFRREESMPEDVCYVEGILGTMWVERPADLEHINLIYSHLQNTALSPSDTRRFISAVLRGAKRG